MKILFVCRQNIGRSQMAQELYKQMHPADHVASAGTIVDVPGQTLAEAPAPKTITVMKELGIDVSANTRHQVTPEMADDYDKIIVMAKPETVPEWLHENPKAVFWDIPDPKDSDVEGARRIRDQIKVRVAEL